MLSVPLIRPRTNSVSRRPVPSSSPPRSMKTSDIQTKSSTYLPALVVITLFPLSTALVYLSITSLPLSTVSWPRTISDLYQITNQLSTYPSTWHILLVLSITCIYKHAWSIPGSVLWNVLAGALFGSPYATLLITTLTVIGSACSTLLAIPLGPFIQRFFPSMLSVVTQALQPASEQVQTPAWVRLSILRLVGVVPWSGINIACGVCRVDLASCMIGTFIGTLPWTAVTCQIGDILHTLAQSDSTSIPITSLLTTPAIIIKLILLSVLSLAPILIRGRLIRRVGIVQEQSALDVEASPERVNTKQAQEHPQFPILEKPPVKIRVPRKRQARFPSLSLGLSSSWSAPHLHFPALPATVGHFFHGPLSYHSAWPSEDVLLKEKTGLGEP